MVRTTLILLFNVPCRLSLHIISRYHSIIVYCIIIHNIILLYCRRSVFETARSRRNSIRAGDGASKIHVQQQQYNNNIYCEQLWRPVYSGQSVYSVRNIMYNIMMLLTSTVIRSNKCAPYYRYAVYFIAASMSVDDYRWLWWWSW